MNRYAWASRTKLANRRRRPLRRNPPRSREQTSRRVNQLATDGSPRPRESAISPGVRLDGSGARRHRRRRRAVHSTGMQCTRPRGAGVDDLHHPRRPRARALAAWSVSSSTSASSRRARRFSPTASSRRDDLSDLPGLYHLLDRRDVSATAALFGAIALWVNVTKRDPTGWGTFLFMALIGELIGLVVNLFWLNNTLYWVTTAVGVCSSRRHRLRRPALKNYQPPPAPTTWSWRRTRSSERPRSTSTSSTSSSTCCESWARAGASRLGPLGRATRLEPTARRTRDPRAKTLDLGLLDGDDLAEGERPDARRARPVRREQRALADHRAGPELARPLGRLHHDLALDHDIHAGARLPRSISICPALNDSSEPTASSLRRSSSSTPPSIA